MPIALTAVAGANFCDMGRGREDGRAIPLADSRTAAKFVLSARPCLLAVGASDLQPKSDDLHDIDRK
jgi:hypothetical protein